MRIAGYCVRFLFLSSQFYDSMPNTCAFVCVDGLRSIARTEGLPGLYRGTWLALFGVSSGAIQFMAYEQMKNFAFARKRRRILAQGGTWRDGEEKLVGQVYFLSGKRIRHSSFA